MNNIKSASLHFNLASIPVGLASTKTTANEIGFTSLHSKCGQPLSMKTVSNAVKGTPGTPAKSVTFCVTCNEETVPEDSVSGYEFAKGQFVQFTSEEIDALKPDRSATIEVDKFIQTKDVTSLMVENSYFLLLGEVGHDDYGLLYQCLAEMKMSAFARHSLWGKERHCLVQPNQDFPGHGVLVMHNLYLYEDLVAPDFSAPIPKRDKKVLAKEMIKALAGDFDPARDLVSESRQLLLDAIQAKIDGKEYSVAAPASGDGSVGLMEALEEVYKEKIGSKK